VPLFEDRIEVIPNGDSGPEIACNHCHQLADRAETIGDFPYLLMCPVGRVTLGEWDNLDQREAEILAFRLRYR